MITLVRTRIDKSILDEIGLDGVDCVDKTMGLFNVCGQYNGIV